MTIIKATPDDAGCYVEGWWGQYGPAHMIIMCATEFGYDDAEVINLAEMAPATAAAFGDPVGITDDEHAGKTNESWNNCNPYVARLFAALLVTGKGQLGWADYEVVS